ncbi:MAG: hypothetical protein JXA41_08415 [Deltaproteobacteria bacterium]|nr:hypothetical protein [Deltaproteobacteria bacterium]
MASTAKRVPYKESIHCPPSVLVMISLVSTLVIDILAFIFVGTPKLTTAAWQWIILLSATIFAISYIYSWLRYSVKLKIRKGIVEDRVFLSLRGIGKGTWRQIPLDGIVSCRQTTYNAPIKGFFRLLLTSHASFKSGNTSSMYPLPGYRGSGIHLEYKRELSIRDGFDNLLIPTKNPDLLCSLIKGESVKT